MQSLLTSKAADRWAARRKVTRKDTDPVSHRHQYVLALHLAGHKVKEIKELTKYSIPMIYRILQEPNVVALRQQILDHTSKEFEALFPKVVDAIREALHSPDLKVALEASDKWLKAHGKYSKSEGTTINVTAEDVVMNLLSQSAENIQNVQGVKKEGT